MSVKAIAVNPENPAAFIEITQPMPQPGEHDLLVEVKAVSINPPGGWVGIPALFDQDFEKDFINL